MGLATAPQPALKDDGLPWLVAGYTATMNELRKEIAGLRREVIAARMGRGNLAELGMAENRIADIEHELLDFARRLDSEVATANALRSVEQAVARRKAAETAPEPPPRRRPPARHRHDELIRHLAPVRDC